MRRNVRLTDRDREALAHLARFRLSTPRQLTNLFFKGQLSQFDNWSRRMRDASLVQTGPLYSNRVYYALTPAAAPDWGLDPREVTNPTRQKVARHFAVAGFATMHREMHVLTATELKEDFPELALDTSSRDYYLHNDQSEIRLGRLLIDNAGDAQPARNLAAKVRRQVESARQNELLAHLIDAGGLIFTYLVTHEAKVTALRNEWSKRSPGADAHVVAIPELREVVEGLSS